MSITFPHRETAESLLFAFQEEGKKCKIHPDLLWYHVNNAAINSDASDLVKRVKKLAGQLAWTKARFLASYFLNYPSFTIEETIKTNKNLPNLTEDELENQIDGYAYAQETIRDIQSQLAIAEINGIDIEDILQDLNKHITFQERMRVRIVKLLENRGKR